MAKAQGLIPSNNPFIETSFANMDRLQDIIRFLTAAGGTPSRDGNSTHFTYEDQGSIRMRTWTGFELNDDQLIADEVRPGTSAPIVNRSHKVS